MKTVVPKSPLVDLLAVPRKIAEEILSNPDLSFVDCTGKGADRQSYLCVQNNTQSQPPRILRR